jgi:uncharacterized membrane protein YgcG
MDSGILVLAGFIIVFAVVMVLARKNRIVHRTKQVTGRSVRGKGSKAARREEELRLKARERDEALFVAQFPELQPYFHPEKLVEFAEEIEVREEFNNLKAPVTWAQPNGFAAATMDLSPEGSRTLCRVKDASGAVLTSFHYEPHPEGGVLRVGKGKLTVTTKDEQSRVRYWHPDREFKWSKDKGWRFTTRVADEEFSRDTGSSFRDRGDTSSSSSGSHAPAAAAAGAAAFAAAGGTFDGGGASQSWDEGGAGSAQPAGSSEGASESTTTAY